ncbi:GNAT family N-acetyltransferase [Providencia heimbachae]|uniref:GNAT family acetyltransferase n=1 Tax=Providencia heimbachae ATCC 35613 TaxID=1354272 RepID=A0A1B7JRH3_9GAMM|nr:N-acetyltransferase [Providencia heimbachae]OAT50497.1 GNAT family acetyltransferase [Providencia heimbachae ATCC 35613]SQH11885.1 ribosomal-protein-alanine N-acetyltransferase [Providencia heimbachae]
MLNKKSSLDFNHLSIEPLTEYSILASSALFFQSFESKFAKLNIPSKTERQLLVSELWKLQFYSQSEQQVVVMYQGNAIAAFGLAIANNKQLPKFKYWETMFKLSRQFGVINTLKATWICSLFKYTPKENEAYLSYIGVDPQYQGKGIGKYVIHWIIEHVKKSSQANTLSLYVAQENAGAKKLYENLGFNIEKYEKSNLTKFSIGFYGWFYMSYAISS